MVEVIVEDVPIARDSAAPSKWVGDFSYSQRLFLLLSFAQTDTRATAVLINKFDAGRLESTLDNIQCRVAWVA
jgi:hypothetical protein